ncbi:hypothetical protein [Alkaliphilus sp. B6464]|uniref:hypothetical protein n=1 Tax=Alkaliphilus sp. B6464 TaxID=2731219 RepID=UPI001BA850F0|nr:hypothetical protein [Alkaliphilus sp. B6464]QUH22191.1 hypothetical protein HYG84_19995 [Alkaliphilus sp. B6464]
MLERAIRKIQDWYGGYLQEYEILEENDGQIIFLISSSGNYYSVEIARVFAVGDNMEISIDQKIDGLDGFFDLLIPFAKKLIELGKIS